MQLLAFKLSNSNSNPNFGAKDKADTWCRDNEEVKQKLSIECMAWRCSMEIVDTCQYQGRKSQEQTQCESGPHSVVRRVKFVI